MSEPWRPLFARDDAQHSADYDALHPGVPDWLKPSLWEWIRGQLCRPSGSGSWWFANVASIRRMERAVQLSIGWDGDNGFDGTRLLELAIRPNDAVMLTVADFCAHQLDLPRERGSLSSLATVLSEGRSEWTATTDIENHGMLQRIVPEGVSLAARAVTQSAGTAGRLLAGAWEATYGLHGNPSEAYRLGVRAVEAASKPVVLLKDRDATLGKVIGTLRASPRQWTFVYPSNDKGVDPYDVLVGMLQTLWTSQYDRHVTENKPLSVSQEEAEAAVVLAVTLVQWFHSGHIRKAA